MSHSAMFTRVVVAVDSADDSASLLAVLPALVPLGAEHFTLVHVAAVSAPVSGAVTPLEGAEAQVTELLVTLREQGLTAHGDVRTGSAADEVLRVADERNATVLVVGARRHSRMYDAIIGSVALSIVERANIPVLIVPTSANSESGSMSNTGDGTALGHHLLLATDFSDTADRALNTALQLVGRARGRVQVTLLHATEGGWELGQGDDSDEARFERTAQQVRDAGAADVETVLLDEDPVEAITRIAMARPNTLALMGTRGRGFLGSLMLGSVSRKVASRISVPLLLVPPTA